MRSQLVVLVLRLLPIYKLYRAKGQEDMQKTSKQANRQKNIAVFALVLLWTERPRTTQRAGFFVNNPGYPENFWKVTVFSWWKTDGVKEAYYKTWDSASNQFNPWIDWNDLCRLIWLQGDKGNSLRQTTIPRPSIIFQRLYYNNKKNYKAYPATG